MERIYRTRPTPVLARIAAAVGLIGLLGQSPALAADGLQPPANWLAVLESPSLAAGEAFIGGVLDDLGYEFVSPLDGVFALLGVDRELFGDRPLIVGLAVGQADGAYPFLLFSPPDLDRMLAPLGGERTGDSAIVEIGGFSLVFAPTDGGVLVAPLTLPTPGPGPGADAPLPPLDGGVRLTLSAAGIRYLAERAEAFDNAERSAARKTLRTPWRWPPRLARIDATIGMNASFWRTVEDRLQRVSISAVRDDGGDITLSASMASLVSRATDVNQPGPVRLANDSPTDRPAVASLRAQSLTRCLPLLVDLGLAYARGRPDTVEAAKFADTQYDAYTAAVSDVADQVSAGGACVLDPREEMPVFANRVAVLATADADGLLESLANVAAAWNELIDASAAKTRLTFDRRPLDRDGYTGVVLAADLVRAAGVDDTPEMRELMAKYVGEEGCLTVRLVRLDDRRVLVSDAPWPIAAEAIAAFREQSSEGFASGGDAPDVALTWRVDRNLAWRAAVRALEMGGAFGFQPAVPMRRALPVTANLRADATGIIVRGQIPNDTLQALGEYLHAN